MNQKKITGRGGRCIDQNELDQLAAGLNSGKLKIVSTLHGQKTGSQGSSKPGSSSKKSLNQQLGFARPIDIGKHSFHCRPAGADKLEIIDRIHKTSAEVPSKDILAFIALKGSDLIRKGILTVTDSGRLKIASRGKK